MIEWDAATGAQRAPPLDLHWKDTAGLVSENVAYNADGSLIASSVAGDRVVIVDADTLRQVEAFPDPKGVAVVAFSPSDPELLAEGSAAGVVRLWNVATRQLVAEIAASTSQSGMESVQFDATGTKLLTQAGDRARLWSVPELHQIGSDLPGVASFAGSAAFTGRGVQTMAVQVYANGQVFVYPASLAAWERQACLVAGRNLTESEWVQFVGDRPYESTCSDYPPGS